MYSVVEKYTEELDEKKVDFFKLGCTIGGSIVVESLLIKELKELRSAAILPSGKSKPSLRSDHGALQAALRLPSGTLRQVPSFRLRWRHETNFLFTFII